ncbi:MAG: hypothetical protein QGF53_08245 [Alphaproteobacteria bacterium]|nr:hypothetical protein [Alphaproteobacteria bacterium]
MIRDESESGDAAPRRTISGNENGIETLQKRRRSAGLDAVGWSRNTLRRRLRQTLRDVMRDERGMSRIDCAVIHLFLALLIGMAVRAYAEFSPENAQGGMEPETLDPRVVWGIYIGLAVWVLYSILTVIRELRQ